MADDFTYDVFLSHSAKDKGVVRPLAERLLADGLRVWLDDWEIRPGDSIPAKIEEGLEHSRVLVLCMSANAFGSDWAQLEAGTFRFRDPLNKARRFIPLRLDEFPIKGSLAQFLYIKWPPRHEQEYEKLLGACRPPGKQSTAEAPVAREHAAERTIQLDYEKTAILSCAFSLDGKFALTGAQDQTLRLWDLETGQCLKVLEGHAGSVWSVALSADQRRALSGSDDTTVRLWDVETGQCLRILEGHTDFVISLAWSIDQCRALSGSADDTVRLWDVETGQCLREFRGHLNSVWSVALGTDLALSGSRDSTIRLWDLETGRCLRVLEGHTDSVQWVAWSADQRLALSGSDGSMVRLWDVESGRCLRVLNHHEDAVCTVTWSSDVRRAFSGDQSGGIQVWDLSEFVTETPSPEAIAADFLSAHDQVQYTNAKVLLVGESGAGKTGLSKRLALNDWQPSDSTVGAWATQWHASPTKN